MMDFRDNVQKCQEYVHALEEERKKIQVFQRELPLCLDLVSQAIETCKQQLSGITATTTATTTTTTTECFNVHSHSECSEQTTSDGPVLEEFIPIKRSGSVDHDEEEELESHKHQSDDNDNNDVINNSGNDKSGKKSDWLRSVQLWNQTPDPPTTPEENQPKRVTVVEVKKNGVTSGAFHPFQKEKCGSDDNNDNNVSKPTSRPAASACSSAETEAAGSGGGKKEEKGGQRKARRCWSPELHRRFLHALQQLGGSHVATPKQIRELMKVDGLTNDEVKSHLQKYRLHTRRPSSSIHNNANQQAPQFVVVGGIWMPPPEYAVVGPTSGDTTTTTAPNGIYAPVAALAAPPPQPTTHRQQRKQCSTQSHSEEMGSHNNRGGRSSSPATSSSTHTTTASHAY